MRKRIILFCVVGILVIISAVVGIYQLQASCCSNLSLNCCCGNFSEWGLYLDDYSCVCTSGRVMVKMCTYIDIYLDPAFAEE